MASDDAGIGGAVAARVMKTRFAEVRVPRFPARLSSQCSCSKKITIEGEAVIDIPARPNNAEHSAGARDVPEQDYHQPAAYYGAGAILFDDNMRNLDLYYEDCVIGGPAPSFMTIKRSRKIQEAIRTKLFSKLQA